MWLFLAFVLVPIIEIALFIQVGGWLGLLPTLLIVVLTAITGTALMRQQGLQALARLQERLSSGGDPVGPIAHGALILVAGILLLTPGFFTDTVGLLLLLPPVRDKLISYGAARITVQTVSFGSRGPGPSRPHPPRSGPAARDTIETEYEVMEDEDTTPGSSGWTRPAGRR